MFKLHCIDIVNYLCICIALCTPIKFTFLTSNCGSPSSQRSRGEIASAGGFNLLPFPAESFSGGGMYLILFLFG